MVHRSSENTYDHRSPGERKGYTAKIEIASKDTPLSAIPIPKRGTCKVN